MYCIISVGYAYKSNRIKFYWTYKIIKSNSPIDGVFISPIGPIAIINYIIAYIVIDLKKKDN